jgi:Transcriptional regulator, AbiEi antitoxin
MHPVLRAVAEVQRGLFTAADARRAGYSPGEVRHLLSSGRWVRVRRGVYADPSDVPDGGRSLARQQFECLALLLELDRPTALASHATAARLWELPVPRREPTRPLRLTDPSGWRRGRDFVIAHAPVAARDRYRSGRLWLTSATRTLVDCAREWALEDSVVAIDSALLDELTTVDDLERSLRECGNWPGAPRARRAVSLSDGRAESALETRGRLRLVGAGIPPDHLQVEIRVDGGLVAVVDGWYDRAAVALEFDGKVKYTDPWRRRGAAEVLWREKRREDELRALDVRVVRLAEEDLHGGWAAAESRLRDLLSRPGPAIRRFTAVPRLQGIRRSA